MTSFGLISQIQRSSTDDGPGIRTTVFLKGCPLHCPWCHNIEAICPLPHLVWHKTRCIGDEACIESCSENALIMNLDGMEIKSDRCSVCGVCVESCPTGALKIIGTQWESDRLVEELLRDKVFFDTSDGGVTISGGEPLLQSQFTIDVASGLRQNGVHVALDTSGFVEERTWRAVLEHIDLVLLDLKNMDPELHLKQTGVNLNRIISNAKILSEIGVPTWIRTPVIPAYTDHENNIRTIAQFIVEFLPHVERYELLAFNKMCIEKYVLIGLEFPLKDVGLVTKKRMDNLASIARNTGVSNVTWSGMTMN